MDIVNFKKLIAEGAETPPSSLSFSLQALWLDACGSWDEAHEYSQKDEGREGAWVHAYLHRKEGDLPNARYWYRRAGQEEFQGSLEEEWEHIVGSLLVGI